MKTLIAAVFLSLSVFAGSAQDRGGDIDTVNYVDLEDYMGLWHELYRLPNSFEEGCYNVTAEYKLLGERVSVENTCVKKNGTKKVAHVTAFVVNRHTNAELKVSFVPILQRWGFFAGDYNVLALGDAYDYALVGSKDRKFLWVLSRTKTLDEEVVKELFETAENLGFDTSKVITTPSL